MFRDEYVTVFKFRTITGSEPNPDYDQVAGIGFANCPNRLIEKIEWVSGVDGPSNLAITQEKSHDTLGKAQEAAEQLAKSNGRKYYLLEGSRVNV